MKITRRQIRKIIREQQADRQADYLLNEGFFDWLKKLGKEMIAAYKKQQQLTTDFEDFFKSMLDDQPEEVQGPTKKIAEKYIGMAQDARKSLLGKIIAEIESENKDLDKKDANKLALAALSYAWSAAGSDGG